MGQHILNKSSFLKGIQCEKQLYLYKYHYNWMDQVSENQQAVFNRGTNVGILAQELFPGGITEPRITVLTSTFIVDSLFLIKSPFIKPSEDFSVIVVLDTLLTISALMLNNLSFISLSVSLRFLIGR
jgi:hypothetical protein